MTEIKKQQSANFRLEHLIMKLNGHYYTPRIEGEIMEKVLQTMDDGGNFDFNLLFPEETRLEIKEDRKTFDKSKVSGAGYYNGYSSRREYLTFDEFNQMDRPRKITVSYETTYKSTGSKKRGETK
ncbi:hypothetical protein J4462_02210 [Candidatus Pacearchaeota archaeon]|nr:hypothetical protein [Candidatus Pacearchaeota archaeon]